MELDDYSCESQHYAGKCEDEHLFDALRVVAHEGIDRKSSYAGDEAGKACIIVVNKWDLVVKDDKTMDKVTDEIQRMIDVFSNSETPVTALQNEEDIVVLQPKEIYMVRVEDGDTIIYGARHKYRSRKRLYELAQQLGKQFMQISKTTLINLSYMDSIEPGFSGTLLLKLKNGDKDYVSRKYLPEFKKYLGL